ncbi:MAG: hypothetical protein AAF585_07600 [Verrucomicrobiota bacterium]
MSEQLEDSDPRISTSLRSVSASSRIKRKRGLGDLSGVTLKVPEEQLKWLLRRPECEDLYSLRVTHIKRFEGSTLINLLAENASKLPSLRSLTLATSEVPGWANPACDIDSLLNQFPGLKELNLRVGGRFQLSGTRHLSLKWLDLWPRQTSVSLMIGLSRSVFPDLSLLSLRNGIGRDWSLENGLAPLLSGQPFPNLKALAFRDFVDQNTVAKLVAKSSVLEQLESLDLTGQMLNEPGANALMNAAVRFPESLKVVINRHGIEQPVVLQLRKRGIEIRDREDLIAVDDLKWPRWAG